MLIFGFGLKIFCTYGHAVGKIRYIIFVHCWVNCCVFILSWAEDKWKNSWNILSCVLLASLIISYPFDGRKRSIHCLCMCKKQSWFYGGISYYRQWTINFLRYTNLRWSDDFSCPKDACHQPHSVETMMDEISLVTNMHILIQLQQNTLAHEWATLPFDIHRSLPRTI